MIKIKNILYRSNWYKKNFYYLRAGQSLSASTKIASSCQETLQIHHDIDDGLKLSEILSDDLLNIFFSPTEISFIKVAERTGNMENIFLNLSELLKSQHQQRQKMINAFIYPIIILCMTFSLLLMMLIFIIPKIGVLFKDVKDLPMITKIVMGASDHLLSYWYIDLFICFVMSLIYVFMKDQSAFVRFKNKIRDFIFSKFILIKDIYLYWYIEKWLNIVYMSLQSKVTLKDSVKFAYESINNESIKSEFEKIYSNIEKGNTITNSLHLLNKNIYKKIEEWVSIIDSGEKTGKLVEVFEICHLNIKEKLDHLFDRFQKIIEPLLIVIVGIVVMIICISIILPMYQLTQSFQ